MDEGDEGNESTAERNAAEGGGVEIWAEYHSIKRTSITVRGVSELKAKARLLFTVQRNG